MNRKWMKNRCTVTYAWVETVVKDAYLNGFNRALQHPIGIAEGEWERSQIKEAVDKMLASHHAEISKEHGWPEEGEGL